MPLILFLLFAFLLRGIAEYTPPLGRTVYLMGSNGKATRFSGLNMVKPHGSVCDFICSVLGHAIIMMAKFNSAKAGYGESLPADRYSRLCARRCEPDGGFGRIYRHCTGSVCLYRCWKAA